MSWFLISFIKQHILCAILFICSMITFFKRIYVLSSVFIAVILFLYVTIFVCRAAVKKVLRQKEVFSPKSKVRNLKYLIIGDMYKTEQTCDCVQLYAPGRSLEACYEILRHTHSILDEKEGMVVIAIKKRYIERKSYTYFDIPFFHYTTINKLKLGNLLTKAPLFGVVANFVKNIVFLLELKSNGYEECDIEADQIKSFCKERNYTLLFKVKK